MSKSRKLSRGQRELREANRFFRGETSRGAAWLRRKRANRLAVLRVSQAFAEARRSSFEAPPDLP